MLCATLVGSVGCGPGVAEDPLDVPEVCGARGPVRLIEAEVPEVSTGDAVWGSALVGERRVAAWFNPSPNEGSDLSQVFGAYVLDPCGGNEVALSSSQYPLVVGDAAFTCDPLDGSIRRLDLDTGASGEVLGSGYDCNPWWRRGSTLFMLNWDANAYGLLRPEGVRLLATELPDIHAESNVFPHAAYLSSWGGHSTRWENAEIDYWAWRHHDRLVALEVSTGELHDLPEGTEWAWGLEDGQDVWVFLEPDVDGIRETLRLETLDATPQPGPAFGDIVEPIHTLDAALPAILREDSILLVERGQSVPRPAFVEAGSWPLMRLDAALFLQQTDAQVSVWDAESGSVVLQFEPPGQRCGYLQFHAAANMLEGAFSDDECVTHTQWFFPLDGSPPTTVPSAPSTRPASFLPGGAFVLLGPDGRHPDDLSVLELATNTEQRLAADIDGLAFPSHLPLPRLPVGTGGSVEYYVRHGEQAGLWLVGVP